MSSATSKSMIRNHPHLLPPTESDYRKCTGTCSQQKASSNGSTSPPPQSHTSSSVVQNQAASYPVNQYPPQWQHSHRNAPLALNASAVQQTRLNQQPHHVSSPPISRPPYGQTVHAPPGSYNAPSAPQSPPYTVVPSQQSFLNEGAHPTYLASDPSVVQPNLPYSYNIADPGSQYVDQRCAVAILYFRVSTDT
ncbi:hypothetical protein K474DRAFT_1658803 [Panus rudis PR-1116 ss-1]|nr:hypothetical protein K474DRAFT_1658803 [Panus rudis PR-1116 ss-1]